MTFHDFSAGENDNGRRIDRIIRHFVSSSGLSGLYSAFRKGLIKINGKKVMPSEKIHSGDTVSIADFLLQNQAEAPTDLQTSPSAFPFPILFHNEHVLIINKPYGISVHGNACALDHAVKQLYSSDIHRAKSLAFEPGPQHRLDRRTSGLLVFSWSIEGAHYLSRAFADGSIQKTYLALVEGELKGAAFWQDSLTANHKYAPHTFQTVQVVAATDTAAKNAITKAAPIAYGMIRSRPCTLVCFELATGRKHQIRVQSAFHGFPLLGDTAYGAAKIESDQQLYLHAYMLSFTENPIALPHLIKAPLPPLFRSQLTYAGIQFQKNE